MCLQENNCVLYGMCVVDRKITVELCSVVNFWILVCSIDNKSSEATSSSVANGRSRSGWI